jgi:hypothetical protein
MTYALTSYFGELLKNIEPPQNRQYAAVEVSERVREFLKNHEDFPTSDPYSRLSGSYRRHTAVGDIKDVDIIVKVDASLEESPGLVIRNLKNTLNSLPDALGLKGHSEIKQSRRSVHVYFEDKDFHLDVVPAIVPKEIDQKLYVPDKSWGKWIESNPIGYCRHLSELNDKYNGKVVPLIKLVKHFRDYNMKIMKPKSYWLESLVVYHVKSGSIDMSQPIAEIFRDLMSAIYNKFAPLLGRDDEATPHIPDPMLGNDISWNWDRTHFETFMNRVKEAKEVAAKALETGNQEEAIKLWQSVFGDEKFPKAVSKTSSKLSDFAPGVAFVGSSGLINPRPSPSVRTVRSQPTTFYGDY